eukprot:TRINITY_DN4915_c0_g3_i1.p1 TRINITY_DN4915_c0_g3~~TRINITY_DN4915_c0_g3_i1.p1  ORF type:complete len:373 (+),score=129.22 TRINITY_DN4915_c0_g3_i1:165-1283(+)
MPPGAAPESVFGAFNLNAPEFHPGRLLGRSALDQPPPPPPPPDAQRAADSGWTSWGQGSDPCDVMTFRQPANEPYLEHHAGLREVWKESLEEAVQEMSALVEAGYNHIAMDTEFPGVVTGPWDWDVPAGPDAEWHTIRENVNMLKLIQLGLSFSDKDGNTPTDGPSTYQINFSFNWNTDTHAVESIQLLVDSGIDFDALSEHGCDAHAVAELLFTSGLVLTDEVTWISFHSGYDFCYLVSLLTAVAIPPEEREFIETVRTFFPVVYDTKHMAKTCSSFGYTGGLDQLAQVLEVHRVGPAHQAGSDSLLTSRVYFEMVRRFFAAHNIDHTSAEFKNTIYGLGFKYRMAVGQRGSGNRHGRENGNHVLHARTER